jgi:hypothetical protein
LYLSEFYRIVDSQGNLERKTVLENVNRASQGFAMNFGKSFGWQKFAFGS